nr:MAG TPA: hypothetical protein [Caudoviricetes sp.]
MLLLRAVTRAIMGSFFENNDYNIIYRMSTDRYL